MFCHNAPDGVHASSRWAEFIVFTIPAKPQPNAIVGGTKSECRRGVGVLRARQGVVESRAAFEGAGDLARRPDSLALRGRHSAIDSLPPARPRSSAGRGGECTRGGGSAKRGFGSACGVHRAVDGREVCGQPRLGLHGQPWWCSCTDRRRGSHTRARPPAAVRPRVSA